MLSDRGEKILFGMMLCATGAAAVALFCGWNLAAMLIALAMALTVFVTNGDW